MSRRIVRRSEISRPTRPVMEYSRFETFLASCGLPTLAMSRCAKRLRFELSRASMHAAENNRLTNGWATLNADDPHRPIQTDARVARHRAEWLALNDPYGSNAVNRIVDNTIGDGITTQVQIDYSSVPKENERQNTKVEDLKKRWMEEADALGQLHWFEMQQLELRRVVVAGEVILQRKYLDDPSRVLPLAYELIDCARLTDFRATVTKGNEIIDGVEVDASGRPVAVHVTDGKMTSKTIRIPMEEIVHPFMTLWPGQVRGVTWLCPVIGAMFDRRDLHEYAIVARKVQSAIAVLVSHDPGGGPAPAIPGFAGMSGETLTNGTGDTVRPLEAGMIQDVGTGRVTSHTPAQTHDLEEITSVICRGMGIGIGMSYEWISGDYNRTSHAGGRLANQHPRKRVKTVHGWFCRRSETVVHRDFVDIGLAMGKIPHPRKKSDIYSARFSQPHWEWGVNPYQEVNAAAKAMETSISTIRDEVESRGGSWQDFMIQIAEEVKFGKEIGLSVHKTLTGEIAPEQDVSE